MYTLRALVLASGQRGRATAITSRGTRPSLESLIGKVLRCKQHNISNSKYLLFAALLILISLSCGQAIADQQALQHSLHKLGNHASGPTLLVIGGIQGDEPGGFTAASLLVTNYTIRHGSVWVIPNLNFESIIKRSRGVYGDMNRKFLAIKKSDPEYSVIQKIKSLILDKRVDIVLNLHDGSGFYRKKYIDKWRNPRRWGQSIIIDQKQIKAERFGDLDKVARSIVMRVNGIIENTTHHYKVKNTKTHRGDKEMEKTLTYFAIRNNKPAFGIEVSKSFRTYRRARYHLIVLEAYMNELGIKYKKDFPLTLAGVKDKINNNIKIALYTNKILFDVAHARKRLNYVPMKKNTPLQFTASNPLVAVINSDKYYKVRYGNRHITFLHPQYFDYDNSLSTVKIKIDNVQTLVPLGTLVNVKRKFMVEPINGYRVNIIGFTKHNVRNESGISIQRYNFATRFSIDKKARMFRVEFYKKSKFSGMILVNFTEKAAEQRTTTLKNIKPQTHQ